MRDTRESICDRVLICLDIFQNFASERFYGIVLHYTPGRKYIGGIQFFAFSVIMFVCLSVCLFVC